MEKQCVRQEKIIDYLTNVWYIYAEGEVMVYEKYLTGQPPHDIIL